MANENKILNFKEFTNQYFDWFKIDKQCESVFKYLSFWAWRHSDFEKFNNNFYLEKGILLVGNVGTGKTEIMVLLQKYLQYLQSPYQYKKGVVWKFADDFNKIGYDSMTKVVKDNWFFDELGLTDENTNELKKESAVYFGNRVLMGAEIIMKRYEVFRSLGYQTHFTTNLTPAEIKAHYGERCFSRLYQMCNFIEYTGTDRRMNTRPVFYNNENEYKPQSPQVPKEQQEHETKEWLNEIYINYCKTLDVKTIYGSHFEFYRKYGVEIATDEELRIIRMEIEDDRQCKVIEKKEAGATSKQEHKRLGELLIQYDKRIFDKEEESSLWVETKRHAIIKFFNKCISEQKVKIL